MKMNKLYIMSMIVGLFTAVVCIPFRMTISFISTYRPALYSEEATFFNITNPITAHIILFVTIFAILYFVGYLTKKYPKIGGSGLPQTQELINGRMVYDRPFRYLVMKYIGGMFALGSGLSLGREGTSVQMGSLAGWITGTVFKIRKNRIKHLISAGAGAGVAAAFTAPLSSSILIIESLQRFSMPQTIVCTLLSGGIAGILAKIFVPNNIYDNIQLTVPKMDEWMLIILLILMGALFAVLGKMFSKALEIGKNSYARLDTCRYRRRTSTIWFKALLLTSTIFLVGLFLPTMIGGDQTFLVSQSNNITTGNRLDMFVQILYNMLYISIITVFTIISNASGYPGGIFLPMMTIGGLCGKLFYLLICLTGLAGNIQGSCGYFVIIGMGAFFISVVRTPLTGFILIGEMTNHYEVFFPTIIAGIATFYVGQLIKAPSMNDILYLYTLKKNEG